MAGILTTMIVSDNWIEYHTERDSTRAWVHVKDIRGVVFDPDVGYKLLIPYVSKYGGHEWVVVKDPDLVRMALTEDSPQ